MNQPQLRTVSRSTAFSRLDFRTKLAFFISVSAIAICWNDPRLSASLTGAVLIACLSVGVPRAYLALMLRVMSPFFLLLLCTHGFFNIQYVLRITGQATLTPLLTLPAGWWVVGGGSLSLEGLLYGINVICKSMTFLLLVPLCVFTTDPNNLTVALVRLRLPYKFAFVISSTLRFFPLIFDEIRAVTETQRLRGYVPEDMGVRERLQTNAGVAVPVILGAMFKAQQIEVVLQARAFSGRPERTYLHESRLRAADWFVIIASMLCLVAALALSSAGVLGHFPATATRTS
jgi:energy-coupling factor transport system permease protein